MMRRKSRQPFGEEELEPMAGMANMMDIMLVFCCGLIVALVLLWNLSGVLKEIPQMIEVEKGKELEELPPVEEGGGSGYQEVGKVFQDPQTGKLILIE